MKWLFFSLITFSIQAQILTPVLWNIERKVGKEVDTLFFTAVCEEGWHIYDTGLPVGGPVSTSVSFEVMEGVEWMGNLFSSVPSEKVYDTTFDMELRWFSKEVSFFIPFKISDTVTFHLIGELEYMACDAEQCLPPERISFSFVSQVSNETVYSSVYQKEDNSLLFIFFTGFMGGLIAIVTPCVWPMIPMTVGFFLKRVKNRRKSIIDAFMYGFSIILIYILIGLVITILFGASALNEMATHAIFNVFFFFLLLIFAVSFFGSFELKFPSSWTTKMDNKADIVGGVAGIFFMAFTLVLVSFSCTGPIIGTLLVEAASLGSLLGPAIGMFGFSLALAIPFAFFSVFPELMKQIPKSGGWMNVIKVTLGFLELALSLKFLSVADMAYGWHILDREIFLSIWIIIFALLGCYLLGFIRFVHDTPLNSLGIFRFFAAIVSLSFSFYMLPGLWGAPLKAISAFTPPLSTQDFNLYENEVQPLFTDYEEGIAYARQVKKPVLIDFTGFGCVNCRKMEASVWTDTRVKKLIEDSFVLVSLFVDDKTPLPHPQTVQDQGRNRRLKTVGDKWSFFQRNRFGANAQPYYIILSPDEKILSSPYTYNPSPEDFLLFLRSTLTP
ncbi:MAG: thioredoxin family protein [Tannerellaceae bacterium]|jgi:thiol:disulfide interchange protein DsbD|nr:thioredoxin family protein [Tannerellaceae bacterium]